ncbi:Flp pilus assembly protein CpaB [Bosea sp. 117]|uniref:Flp pilus assembly protein CpaB n=1 Tax=Bosea sp. 117 TaxID=1125973 RepID=UPI0004944865|nr:Flp pilus assembly protein CpaB [Bosea sp. 117]
MKIARIVVLMVAVVAGGTAYVLSRRGTVTAPAPQVTKSVDTVGVLVARRDIDVGRRLTADDLTWQSWPTSSAGDGTIRQTNSPDAIGEYTGAVARGPFFSGEPIRTQKIIKADGSGFLSAILASGMRAVSIEVNEDKRAAGFILPNDRVDVLLTHKDTEAQKRGTDQLVTETVLTNIRVLTVGQTIEEKDGDRSVAGKTPVTLELDPGQAEILASASENGTLSLSLRSIADSAPGTGGTAKREANSISIVRYGVPSVATSR